MSELGDRQIELVEGRMQFYENKRNWRGMVETCELAMLWFNLNLWLDRLPFPNEESRDTFVRVYLPTLSIITNHVFLEKYKGAKRHLEKEERAAERKPNLVQRFLGVFSRN